MKKFFAMALIVLGMSFVACTNNKSVENTDTVDSIEVVTDTVAVDTLVDSVAVDTVEVL